MKNGYADFFQALQIRIFLLPSEINYWNAGTLVDHNQTDKKL